MVELLVWYMSEVAAHVCRALAPRTTIQMVVLKGTDPCNLFYIVDRTPATFVYDHCSPL